MLGLQNLDVLVKGEVITLALFTPDAGDEPKIMLFKNNLTPNRTTVFADLVEADFTGYARKACGAGAASGLKNPVTGCWEIRPKEPLGGFEFNTTGTGELPQTIYGYALVASDEDVIFAIGTFETPILLNEVLQVIDVPQPILSFPLNIFA